MGDKQNGPKGSTFIVRGQQVVLRRRERWEQGTKSLQQGDKATKQQGIYYMAWDDIRGKQ
ncbi:hypothetical protein GCM10010129_84180 [Streptomyces fumigatiscleroticus]|nr:hypothetical protein GCM10010129_84180 [Streptomyces fumigatiscleroticus]